MSNGRISEMGTYQDLLSHDKAFAQFLKTYLTQNDDAEADEEGEFLVSLCKTPDFSCTDKPYSMNVHFGRARLSFKSTHKMTVCFRFTAFYFHDEVSSVCQLYKEISI